MPGPLKNARHERFAQELAKGCTHGEAYAAAGYKRDDKNAARLTKNDGVAARVAQLKSKAAEKVVVTVADIAQQLDEDREFARQLNQASAAVSASMGKAKVLGLLEDRAKVDITTAGRPLGLGDFYGNGSTDD
jgi:phage terminase small subunit